jgi:hypothetical protein
VVAQSALSFPQVTSPEDIQYQTAMQVLNEKVVLAHAH